MLDLQFSSSLIFCMILPFIFLVLASLKENFSSSTRSSDKPQLPTSYPIIGSLFAILNNKDRHVQWTSEIVTSCSPNLTFTLQGPFGQGRVITANVANVEHVLKTNFHNYEKGHYFRTTLRDFLGDGIFNADGDNWKFQRQVSSHEFSTKSLRKFVEAVVDAELSERLIPILENAAAHKTVLDFQDILQRFTFDNICKIAFGYDPEYLSPSLPQSELAVAFDEAMKLSTERFLSLIPYFWKIKRALNIGSEKQLKIVVKKVRGFAKEIISEKKKELEGEKKSPESVDLLSRFLCSGHSDEDFVADIIISFMLASRDSTSAALTWFFWLVSNHQEVENEILKEIEEKSEAIVYDEVKDMVYTHASICESMRLYPPVPIDTKACLSDDVLPDGTFVKKGTRVAYHPYAMGRVEKVWGRDWAEFRPTRWLEREELGEKWRFINRDSYTYPVFQAGPRICLGKEMAFLQMQKVVAGVLRRFRVVPVVEEGVEPVYVANLTAKMKDGLPVTIEHRVAKEN